MSDQIQLGSTKGYLARPSGKGPWPAVIVVQEWWGLDAQTKSIADRFAEEGYLAFAPDLYHGELAQLGDGETAMKLVQKYGPKAPTDLEATFDAIRSRSEEHTSELQSRLHLVCRLLLLKRNILSHPPHSERSVLQHLRDTPTNHHL